MTFFQRHCPRWFQRSSSEPSIESTAAPFVASSSSSSLQGPSHARSSTTADGAQYSCQLGFSRAREIFSELSDGMRSGSHADGSTDRRKARTLLKQSSRDLSRDKLTVRDGPSDVHPVFGISARAPATIAAARSSSAPPPHSAPLTRAAVPATWRAAPQPSPADRRRCRRARAARAGCRPVGAEVRLDQRDRRGIIAALKVGAAECELRARVGGVDRRGALQQRQRFVEPSQLQQRVARELHQARVVGTGAQQRIDCRQRLLVITGGIAGRRELEGQRGISRRQLQCGGQFRNRVLLPILGAGDRGAGRAPLWRVGERVEMRVRRSCQLARDPRQPVARLGI